MNIRRRWPELLLGGGGALWLVVGRVADVVSLVGAPDWLRPWLVAVGAFVLGSGAGIAVARWRWRLGPEKRSAGNLALLLHTRWFPDETGQHPDEGYRVSIFVPRPNGVKPKEWVCLARTGVDADRSEPWPYTDSPQAVPYAGLVNATAIQKDPKHVPGVPIDRRQDLLEIARYLRDTFVDKARHARRSWKYATMRTLFSRRQNGTIVCILVVEREDGLPIEVRGRSFVNETHDPARNESTFDFQDVCALELEFAAQVWATAWEEEDQ
jgi:hypothetical protein